MRDSSQIEFTDVSKWIAENPQNHENEMFVSMYLT